MHILFLFLDGIGLGPADPTTNPFVAASVPTLRSLAGGQAWTQHAVQTNTNRALFIPTDANLGVSGRPQSATGQGTILTGVNIPAELGYHYGPRPNDAIVDIVQRDTLIKKLTARNLETTLLNAYPPPFFAAIESGKRRPSSAQLALLAAGVRFRGMDDLREGKALHVDFTGQLWHEHIRAENPEWAVPVISPQEAGQRIVSMAREADFTFFDNWLTDYIGHRGTLKDAIDQLQTLDAVLAAILDAWADDEGLIILTSDHGNMEEMGHRKHTENLVPTVVIGSQRDAFADGLSDLSDFAPRILEVFDD
ncbi:MAG: metalloenzyme domain-containing protein [Chloroflexi bacterium]|nr:metalloenzyme domain-containing protein [Chloroflexota bacterium]